MRRPAILQRKRCFTSNEMNLEIDSIPKTMIITAHNNIRSVMKSLNRMIVVQPSTVPRVSIISRDTKVDQVTSTKEEEKEEKEEVRSEDKTQEVYQCESCDETFVDRSSLIIHKTEKSILRTRAALREPSVRYTCETCKRRFVSKARYDRHYKNCAYFKVDSVIPDYKRRRRRNPPQPRKLNDNGEEDPSPCTKCEKVFKKEKYLKVHMTTAHGEHIICQICETKFDTIALLKTHMSEAHSGDFTEHCPICNKGFYLRQSLKVHMTAHQRDDKLSPCGICGKNFRHEVYLRKHMQLMHHSSQEHKRFRCDKCDYETMHKTCFREHVYTHTGEDIIGCEVCGKQMRRGYLKIHLRIHTGEKPEICEYCGKAFSARKYLTKHRLTHTGEKPYKCQKCGKEYTQRGTLTVHLKKHHPQEAKDWIAKGPGRRPHMMKEKEKREVSIDDDGIIVEIMNQEDITENIKEEEIDLEEDEEEEVDVEEEEEEVDVEQEGEEEQEFASEDEEITIQEVDDNDDDDYDEEGEVEIV